MNITILDFLLINCLSYVGGVATGLIICCKYKDKILIKSRSRDNLSTIDRIQNTNQLPYTSPVLASAPAAPAASAPSVTKITLE